MLDMERVDKWIDEHKQQIVDELCAWIRIRSVSDATEAQPGQPFGPGCAQAAYTWASRLRARSALLHIWT